MRAAVTAKVVSPTSTVFVAQVGEPPNIPRSDDRPHDRQDELGFGAPLSPLLGFLGRRNRASAILPLPDHRLQFGESWGFLCCFVFFLTELRAPRAPAKASQSVLPAPSGLQ